MVKFVDSQVHSCSKNFDFFIRFKQSFVDVLSSFIKFSTIWENLSYSGLSHVISDKFFIKYWIFFSFSERILLNLSSSHSLILLFLVKLFSIQNAHIRIRDNKTKLKQIWSGSSFVLIHSFSISKKEIFQSDSVKGILRQYCSWLFRIMWSGKCLSILSIIFCFSSEISFSKLLMLSVSSYASLLYHFFSFSSSCNEFIFFKSFQKSESMKENFNSLLKILFIMICFSFERFREIWFILYGVKLSFM